MRHVLGVLFVAGFCACSGAPPMVGAAASSVDVAGSVPRPRSFDREALELLGTVEVRWEHDGATKTCLGVALSRLLSECGHEAGPGGRALTPRERRPGWGKIVAAEAADGHQAIFSASEVDPDAGPTRSYLVWLEDGQPLPAKDGPFRLVTPTDKRGFRSVRQLTTLRVVVARGSSR